MISRLAATVLLLAALGACSGPQPTKKAPEVKTQPRATAMDPGYKAARSPTDIANHSAPVRSRNAPPTVPGA